MCTAAAAVAGAGAGVSAVGSIMGADAQDKQEEARLRQEKINAIAMGQAYKLNAEARAYEADQKEIEAQFTEGFGRESVRQLRREVRTALSQQTVDITGANRDLTSETSLALAFESAQEGEREALKVRTQTFLDARALREQATSLRIEGKLLKRQAKLATTQADEAVAYSAKPAGYLSASAKLLQSGSRVMELA